MKPEKVKSRWRRNSEMENSEKSSMSPMTLETCDENSCNEKIESMNKEINGNVSSQPFPVYESLDENVYLFEIKRTKGKKEVRRMVCDCPLAKDNEIPCGEECLNRLLMIECGSRCVNGDLCSNKRFQKQLYAKSEPFMTEKKGWGLKLLEDVSKGSFIIEYVGEVINLKEFKLRVKQYARKTTNHFYFMALKSDEIIDATNKANLSRFINHSCDPNTITEKWTVNGLLRVGFFAKRDIKAGEELSFDYQFERYGRQAQKCFCESDKCNGYIGVSNDITVDIYNNDSKYNNKRKKFEREERKKEALEEEDLMLEKEIEKLSLKGIRNKEETLMLARLMVRAEDSHSRGKLLDIILNTAEAPCLRLFLDYHGLSLIWSWMAYLKDGNLKTKILKVLSLLPVPNRTCLMDSKVLSVVENWASCCENSFNDSKSNLTDPSKRKCDTYDSETDALSTVETSFSASSDKASNDEGEPLTYNKPSELRSDDESTDIVQFSVEDDVESKPNLEIAGLAQKLLEKWKLLKDEFRIPRREKPHSHKNGNDSLCLPGNVIRNSADFGKHAQNKTNSKESKESKDSGFIDEPQEIKVVCNIEDKFNPYRKWGEFLPESKLSKEDRRYSDYPDSRIRYRKKNKERNKNDSYHNLSNFNGFTDYYSSPSNHTYDSSYILPPNPSANNETMDYPVGNIFNPIYMNSNPPRPPLLPTPGTQSNIIINPAPDGGKETVCDPARTPSMFVQHAVQMPFLPMLPNAVQSPNNFPSTLSLPLPPPPIHQHVIGVSDNGVINSSPLIAGTSSCLPDTLLSTSSYLNPPSNQTSLPVEAVPLVQECYQTQENNETPFSKPLPAAELPPNWKAATDAEGNTYYYHMIERISQWEFPSAAEEPASADVDNGTPTYDEPDTFSKHATKSRKSHKKHSKKKSLTTAPADTSSQVNSEIAKKIKELFRTKMSSFVVSCLNPYRKDNCRVGRITSNEDFKHLARKLTHFVMAKELKHCKNVQDLDCNDNVKEKARVYIHKMMARYGPLYKKDKCFSDDKYVE